MAIYLFLINGNTNRLTVPGNMSTKFYKDISIFTQVRACTDGRTDGQTVTRISTRLFIMIIYIYIILYLTRLVLGDTNNR